MEKNELLLLTEDVIASKIHLIRGVQVMLDLRNFKT